jgi:hypothetical protein
MRSKQEVKEVVLLRDLPEHLRDMDSPKIPRRSAFKSIQQELKLEVQSIEGYDNAN